MKRISLIRSSNARVSPATRRDERCARVGITGASIRNQNHFFEVLEGTDHHVDAEVALLRNLPDADVHILDTALDISHRQYNDWSERDESSEEYSSHIERASELATELSNLVRDISKHVTSPAREAGGYT